MTNKNSANNAKFNTVALTEQELVKFERETIVKLSEVVPIWYQQLGPGLDPVFAGLSLMLKAVDSAVSETERARAADLEIRAVAVRALAANLAIPTLPSARILKSKRLKALGGKQKAKLEMDYEAKTIELIAGDFPAWYDEVGFGGFLRSLVQLVETFREVYLGYVDDESVDSDSVFLLTAFEIRRRFDKVPQEMLEALEMMSKVDESTEAAAA